MKHLDLFSGIGGFALAAETVWPDIEHTFVEFDPFCQSVLRKHWPKSQIHGDIKQFITEEKYDILTGGFPCQPFSQAGRRKGTDDNRYLWPEMFRVIQLTKPTWVIAENVRGLATWNDGMVFEQVCTDLESEGYDVQPVIIPAVAVNAPHRRDRIWFVAYSTNDKPRVRPRKKQITTTQKRRNTIKMAEFGKSDKVYAISNTEHDGLNGSQVRKSSTTRGNGDSTRQDEDEQLTGSASSWDYVTNPTIERQSRQGEHSRPKYTEKDTNRKTNTITSNSPSWNKNWIEVATELCPVDDGLPNGLVRPRGWRNAALKAAGNAIVPQVAIQIMKSLTL